MRSTLLTLCLALTCVACKADSASQPDAGDVTAGKGGAYAADGGQDGSAQGGQGGADAEGGQGGSGSGSAQGGQGGQGGAAAESSNLIELSSDSGDYIGRGQDYAYTEADAQLMVTISNNKIAISVAGDEMWNATFVSKTDGTPSTGHYGDATRAPFQDAMRNGLDWSGEGRGCNMLTGSFDIDTIELDDSMNLSALDLRFEQHCEGSSAALRGKVHWRAEEQRDPAGPVDPAPSGLWEPAQDATPSSGRYVYLQSDGGDYIGGGATRTYTQMNAQLTLTTSAGHIAVAVTGDQSWTGDFAAAQGATQLERGFYGDLKRYPFNNPVKGGLSWSGDGRGCNTLNGWFVVDQISYDNNMVASMDLRFEQHCEGNSAALRGKIHWQPDDTTAPPSPMKPPADLWQPANGATPNSPRYVYLQSESGDSIGGGNTYTYTQANAFLMTSGSNTLIHIAVTGDQDWTGDFAAPSGASGLVPGYYADLARYPFQNPVKGGLNWSGEGRGCNMLKGWFAIDSVIFQGSVLSTLDLRFEQHCENNESALHGKIHWSASDPTVPPGPANPFPDGIWAPASGVTPASGNYVYLASDQGDYVGGGVTTSYPIEASAVSSVTAGVHISVSDWTGDFVAMRGQQRLVTGYYGDLARYPFHNPVKGGMDWSGQGRGCNTLEGWFAVDAVTYTDNTVTALDLRFEQHCESNSAALHGKVHLAP